LLFVGVSTPMHGSYWDRVHQKKGKSAFPTLTGCNSNLEALSEDLSSAIERAHREL
jgi:hypothetical protein